MENFDLGVSDNNGYTMRVAVIDSPAGNVAAVEVDSPPYSALDLAEKHDPDLRAIASDITAQVLPDAVWQAWRESWAAAGDDGIRLRIRCADAESTRIPWELLYDAERRYFLAQDPRSPIVRYLEGPIPDAVRPIEGRLRLLLTGASPADQDELAVDKELDGIASISTDAARAGRVEITRVDDLTLDALDGALLEARPHLFHFSGHGVWEDARDAGYLVLDNGSGESVSLADNMLAMLLRNRGVALVVLNACDTALWSDAWAGMAQSLVLAGVPAVVAMQTPVSDGAAAAFAGALYAALANRYGLEQAVTLARQTVARQSEEMAGPGEWLAPALFLRTGGEQFWPQEQPEKRAVATDHFTIERIDAVNVAETQIIDQRGAEITVGDRRVDTGGGAYVGGSVTVSGSDFVGRDSVVNAGNDGQDAVDRALTKLAATVALQTPAADIDRAMKLMSAMAEALAQGNDDKLADCIGDLAALTPGAGRCMKQAFSDPPLSDCAGPAARYALRRVQS